MSPTLLKRLSLLFLLVLGALSACKDDDVVEPIPMPIPDPDPVEPTDSLQTISRQLTIFCTQEEQPMVEELFQWFDGIITEAQAGLDRQLTIEPHWVIEDAPSFSLNDSIDQVFLHDASRWAGIIGPSQPDHALQALQVLENYNKQTGAMPPLILPKTLGIDLHRRYEGLGYAWFTAESDMSEAEMMLAVADSQEYRDVALLSTSDAFGQTYYDKMPFMTTEWRMHLLANKQVSPSVDDATLEAQFLALYEGRQSDSLFVMVASSDRHHYEVIDRLIAQHQLQTADRIGVLFADNACYLGSEGRFEQAYALTPYSENYEFDEACLNQTFEIPVYGQAHYYDAMLMAFLSAWGSLDAERGLNAKQVLDQLSQHQSAQGGWDAAGIRQALTCMQQGQWPQITGATGIWNYRDQTPLHTSYMLWSASADVTSTQIYDSETLSLRGAADIPVDYWLPGRPDESVLDPDVIGPDYNPVGRHLAVLVASSQSLVNYRHTADVLAVYHLLLDHGYTHDDILLVGDTSLLSDPGNLLPGDIHNTPGGPNLALDATFDYDIDQLSVTDIGQLLCGEVTPPLKPLFDPTPSDNVFFYWCGHGDADRSLRWKNDAISALTFCDWMSRIPHRKMFTVIEACYSGGVAEMLDVPGLLCLTAASANEPSMVCLFDKNVSNHAVSNEFSHHFIETAAKQPDITLGNLYLTVYSQTPNSHATISDIRQYGCLVKETLREYLYQ